ncbi:HIT family protein [Candidatus Woesearchaeota archaeon]|nr:HIT family protein [Candidatus Woesearchaeota archaeon]MBU3941648.1 HIT family protein [Nanoarchaeota archaeon]
MDCIFCKIVRGEIPSNKVYENKNFFAFLDIGPVNRGHTLIIPKKHYKNLLEMPEEELKGYMEAIQKVSKAILQGVNADGISINMSNEPAAGQVVMHAHFHIIPRLKNDGLKLWPQSRYKEGEAEEIKNKITNSLE